jgi:hypothetical protein
MNFVDWIPAIISTREFCSFSGQYGQPGGDTLRLILNILALGTVGYLVTSLLDKSHLHSYGSDSWGGEGSVAWRARVVLFIGVALMAGGLAGSLVRLDFMDHANERGVWGLLTRE